MRWLDTALNLEAARLSVRALTFGIESGVKPPHSKTERPYLTTISVNGGTRACKYTSIPTRQAKAMLWKKT